MTYETARSLALLDNVTMLNHNYLSLFIFVVVLASCGDSPRDGHVDSITPLSTENWTYIQVDSLRQKWGDWDAPEFLRYFGLDMADVTGDGYEDIVSGRYFYRNPGGDLSEAWMRVDLGLNVDGMLFIDVDGDDLGDVIGTALPDVYWLEAKDNEASTWDATKIGELAVTGHLNGQGYRVAQVIQGGKPEILLGVGDGIYYLEIPANPADSPWPKTLVAPEAYDEGIGVADIDGDGDLDIAAGIEVAGNDIVPGTTDLHWLNSQVAWWENPGDGSGPWKLHLIGVATQADRFELGDVNGDGRPDLVISEERYPGTEPNASIHWFEAPANPSEGDWVQHTILSAFSLNNLDLADIDSDGDLDVITNEHKGPDLRTLILLNDGKGTFTTLEIGSGREAHLGAQVSDLDGDGDLDIVSHAWDAYQHLHVWRNDANRPDQDRVDTFPPTQANFGDPASAVGPSYQLDLEVYGNETERRDRIVEIDIDFAHHLQQVGSDEPLNLASLQLVELDAQGRMIDSEVDFQFDILNASDPSKRANGTLVFNLQGTTPVSAVRYYRLFFGDRETPSKNHSITPKVLLEDIGEYQGNPTWKISTPGGAYYYHRDSGGFASLIDKDGNDWISYRPGGRDKGEYRGIPNVAPVDWHPGRPEGKKESQILAEGPLRIRLLTESEDEKWRAHWDIYPYYATMTLQNVGSEPYWILYEGTPGGEFNLTDYWVDSSGRRFDDMARYEGPDKAWHGDLPAPEWVYFGDAGMNRVMFFIHHEDDQAIDEFWNFGEGGMTVFGFGRGPRQEGWQRLTAVPAHLTVGFSEENDHPSVTKAIDSILKPIRFTVGIATKIGNF